MLNYPFTANQLASAAKHAKHLAEQAGKLGNVIFVEARHPADPNLRAFTFERRVVESSSLDELASISAREYSDWVD